MDLRVLDVRGKHDQSLLCQNVRELIKMRENIDEISA